MYVCIYVCMYVFMYVFVYRSATVDSMSFVNEVFVLNSEVLLCVKRKFELKSFYYSNFA